MLQIRCFRGGNENLFHYGKEFAVDCFETKKIVPC